MKICPVISTSSIPVKTSHLENSKSSNCAVTSQTPNFKAEPPKVKKSFWSRLFQEIEDGLQEMKAAEDAKREANALPGTDLEAEKAVDERIHIYNT